MSQTVCPLWENQQEALQVVLSRPAAMLDMEMGTGKTRVAIEAIFARRDVNRVLVVCPKAVIPVWRQNLIKFKPHDSWQVWDDTTGSVKSKTEKLANWVKKYPSRKQIVVMNYDIVWRKPMGDLILKFGFRMTILDESHKIKAAGSKVSKFAALLGKRIPYRLCLSGTPMASSPLDVYGQYRFLDPRIFGTNYYNFLNNYAIMGGAERRFPVGLKNQKELNRKFSSIAYTCRMESIADRIKLPAVLPPVSFYVDLPASDKKLIKELNKDFIAECHNSTVVINNVLTKMVRLQQITSGFCMVVDNPLEPVHEQQLNHAKKDALNEILQSLTDSHIVVFAKFKHDLQVIRGVAENVNRKCFEISGTMNELTHWQKCGGVLAAQIQAGAEGVDMTMAHHAIYFSLPSLSQYTQSKARLYRPGQRYPVSFIHILAKGTIDEAIYKSLAKKEDVIDSVKNGTFDFGYLNS